MCVRSLFSLTLSQTETDVLRIRTLLPHGFPINFHVLWSAALVVFN